MLLEDRRKLGVIAAGYRSWVGPILGIAFVVSVAIRLLSGLGGYDEVAFYLCIAAASWWLTMPVLSDISREMDVSVPLIYFRIHNDSDYGISLLSTILLMAYHFTFFSMMIFVLLRRLFF